MRTEKVNFKRYHPSKGKALKITQRGYNRNTCQEENQVVYTDAKGVLVDGDNLAAPVEEVPLEEYEEWYADNL